MCEWPKYLPTRDNGIGIESPYMGRNDVHSLQGKLGSVVLQQETIISNFERIFKMQGRGCYSCFLLRKVFVREVSSGSNEDEVLRIQ